MDTQIQLLLQQLVSTDKITDPALEGFGASISSTIFNYSDEELLPTLEVIRTTLLSKGSSAYDLQDDNYERIVMIYFMRGVFHAIRSENKDNAEIIWTRMSSYFKSKQTTSELPQPTMHDNSLDTIAQENQASIGELKVTPVEA